MEHKHEGKRSEYDGAISLTREALEKAYNEGERNFAGAYLWGTNLEGVNLSGANLKGAFLWGANLRNANLSGANLEGANLSEASLFNANLEGANLEGTNLSGATRSGANLSGAILWGANLRNANLSGAYLDNTNLCAAQLPDEKVCIYPPDYVVALRNEQTHRFQVKVITFFSSVPSFHKVLCSIIFKFCALSQDDIDRAFGGIAFEGIDQNQAGTDDIKQVGSERLLVEDPDVGRERQNDAQGDPVHAEKEAGSSRSSSSSFFSQRPEGAYNTASPRNRKRAAADDNSAGTSKKPRPS